MRGGCSQTLLRSSGRKKETEKKKIQRSLSQINWKTFANLPLFPDFLCFILFCLSGQKRAASVFGTDPLRTELRGARRGRAGTEAAGGERRAGCRSHRAAWSCGGGKVREIHQKRYEIWQYFKCSKYIHTKYSKYIHINYGSNNIHSRKREKEKIMKIKWNIKCPFSGTQNKYSH